MSVWILNFNVYLEHPLIGIFLFLFIYLFFLKKNIYYLFILLPEAAVLQ